MRTPSSSGAARPPVSASSAPARRSLWHRRNHCRVPLHRPEAATRVNRSRLALSRTLAAEKMPLWLSEHRPGLLSHLRSRLKPRREQQQQQNRRRLSSRLGTLHLSGPRCEPQRPEVNSRSAQARTSAAVRTPSSSGRRRPPVSASSAPAEARPPVRRRRGRSHRSSRAVAVRRVVRAKSPGRGPSRSARIQTLAAVRPLSRPSAR